jgi:hypothetical protein
MPAINLTPTTLDRAYLAWGCAEAASPWRIERNEEFPTDLVERIEQRRMTADDEREVIARTRGGRRGRETESFQRFDMTWYEADFPIAELGDAVLHPHWAFRIWRTDPPRTVRTFLARPDRPSEFELGRAPDPARDHPLIFLAVHMDATPRIAEGNHRAVAMWHFHLHRDARYQGTCRVILGVHREIDQWGDYAP